MVAIPSVMVAPKPKSGSACFLRSFMLTAAAPSPCRRDARGEALAMGANGARALAPIGASLLYRALGGYESLFGVLAVSLGVVSVLMIATNRQRIVGADKYLDGVVVERLLSRP